MIKQDYHCLHQIEAIIYVESAFSIYISSYTGPDKMLWIIFRFNKLEISKETKKCFYFLILHITPFLLYYVFFLFLYNGIEVPWKFCLVIWSYCVVTPFTWSHDLKPWDFFLWGYLKQKVYINHRRSIEELKDTVPQCVENNWFHLNN